MPYYCTVPRCTSMAGKAKNVSFHQFPRDEELAKLWNKILKRGKPYTKYSKVCSLHFTPEDYTITSVGKNKGQWRTLRKDAIPSQNLPSESPTPYQRKQWVSWAREPQANLIDPAIHQQVAQAIYVQTMLAMQAAGAPEVPALHHDNGIPPAPPEAFAHTSATSDTDILKGKQTNTHKSTSYKCTECSKYFKDPDVFILHKRSHIKHEKTEKENFNLNLTLQANPILANLLKSNTENTNIFDNNFSVENFLMTALAANMEGYMRNFSSLIKAEHQNGHVDPDQNDSQLDDDHSDHNNRQLDHDQGHDNNREVDQEYSDQETGQNDQESSRDEHDNDHTDDTDQSGHKDQDMEDGEHNKNDVKDFQDCQSTSQSVLDYSNSLYNNNKVKKANENNMNHNGDNVIHDGHMKNDLMNRDNNLFHNKTMGIHNNYDNNRIIRYYENNDSGSSSGERSMMDHNGKMNDDRIKNDKSMKTDHIENIMAHVRGIWDRDSETLDHAIDAMDHASGIKDDNDSQGSSDGPICDKDYNESVDSNKLVIDETF